MDLSGVGVWSGELRYGNAAESAEAAAELEELNASEPGRYRKPLSAMTAFLDGLDQADAPVPAEKRVLAALGPKMLELAVRRTGGVHPYLVPPEHTRLAREAVRDGALVLPEQPVILCSTRDEARAIGNEWLRGYLSPAQLPGQRTAPGVLGRGRGVP